MKIVLQRVTQASVGVDGAIVGSIGCGYVVLLGIGAMDDELTADKLIEKIKKLRLFADDTGKTNRSIDDINGELLIVSQFTLYADCRKGNRPSFTDAAPPEKANALYEYFIKAATPHFAKVAHGSFGACMQVELVNDGPFTIVLES
ncbi:MAG: D-aminoacyl-tRNA deacylase [Defluviitaleaceae bacterium]|nr:D-aminoacyl-tRNA deacylase [Defluviitaleaceae bacterium]